MLLEGHNVSKNFGGLTVLKNLNFFIREKELVGLIGPNGAGKTTLFNIITGYYKPSSGKIIYDNMDITGKKPYEICKMGIVRTFQSPQVFLNMTVLENVITAALYGKFKKTSFNDAKSEAMKYLEFTGLNEKKNLSANSLNMAERKLLELARALACEPRVLLLDELVAGLNPFEVMQLTNLVKRIREELGITIFWIEHVMQSIMNAAERIIVLHYGLKIAEGKPEEIVNNEEVLKAYLGKGRVQ
jgi:branched-chain amino acid transport system ATP-binding protein